MPDKTAFRLSTSTDTLTKLLAPAEADIMQIIWRQGCATVKQVHRIRTQHRDIAYTTTMTLMSRLAEKGLLQRDNRHGIGGAYTYTPVMSEQAFVATRLQEIIGAVERDYPAALAQCLEQRPTAR
jgi:predicted transcriptional regulator